jgi:alpha-galactosidase/6-phospho-beta-glucosidase family protein
MSLKELEEIFYPLNKEYVEKSDKHYYEFTCKREEMQRKSDEEFERWLEKEKELDKDIFELHEQIDPMITRINE